MNTTKRVMVLGVIYLLAVTLSVSAADPMLGSPADKRRSDKGAPEQAPSPGDPATTGAWPDALLAELEKMSALPEAQFSPLRFFFALERVSEEERQALTDQMGRMELELRQALAQENRPEFIVTLCNDYFFGRQLFTLVPAYLSAPLTQTLKNKQGPGEGLTAVYWSLARGLELPVKPVLAGEHLLLRYEAPGYSRNIEMELRGRARLDSSYQELYGLDRGLVARGAFLRSLSSREAMGGFLYYHGRQIWKEGRVREAEPVLALAARCYPDYLPLSLLLAELYSSQEKRREAVGCLDRVLAVEPGHLPALLSRAQAQEQLGNFEPALRDFQKLVERRGPADPVPLRGRARCLAHADRSREALADWAEVLKTQGLSDPDREEALREMRELRVGMFRDELASPDDLAKFEAVRGLGQLEAEEAVPDLIGQLGGANQRYHWFVISVLKRLTGQDAGGDRAAWQQWWEKEGAASPSVPTPAAGQDKP